APGRARGAFRPRAGPPPARPPRPARDAARRARSALGRGLPLGPSDGAARAALPPRRGRARVSEAPSLVDSHCHLAEPDFDAERAEVLVRAAANGVTGIVCLGATGPPAHNSHPVALTRRSGAVDIVAALGL